MPVVLFRVVTAIAYLALLPAFNVPFFAGPAAAEDVVDYDRDGWMGTMIEGNGQFLGCMVKQDPPVFTSNTPLDSNSIFFGLMQLPDRSWTMVFSKQGGLKPNMKWPMDVLVDGEAIHDGVAAVGAKGVAILQPGLSAAAMQQLRMGANLTIRTERGTNTYSLAGSSAALEFAGACVTEVVATVEGRIDAAELQAQITTGTGQTAMAKAPRARTASTGTGFMATAVGHLLTNAHVVNGCAVAEATLPGQPVQTVKVLARDTENDLALLAPLTGTFVSHPPIRPGVRTGEPVAAYGFPYAGLLPSMGNFTIGNITATAGLQDDGRYVQMSAPIQPGSSGGPLLDAGGNLVGVVVARLNPKTEGAGSQNVNFAIKADVVQQFLVSQKLTETEPPGRSQISAADLAEQAKTFTVFVSCKPDGAVAMAQPPVDAIVGLTAMQVAVPDPAAVGDAVAAFFSRRR